MNNNVIDMEVINLLVLKPVEKGGFENDILNIVFNRESCPRSSKNLSSLWTIVIRLSGSCLLREYTVLSSFIGQRPYLFLIPGTSFVWLFPRWVDSPKNHGNRAEQDSVELYLHSDRSSIVKVQLFVGTRLIHEEAFTRSASKLQQRFVVFKISVCSCY